MKYSTACSGGKPTASSVISFLTAIIVFRFMPKGKPPYADGGE